MFLGSELAGRRAVMVVGLKKSAWLIGHDLLAYLSEVVPRLPTQLNCVLQPIVDAVSG
jgi:hypothetical protein